MGKLVNALKIGAGSVAISAAVVYAGLVGVNAFTYARESRYASEEARKPIHDAEMQQRWKEYGNSQLKKIVSPDVLVPLSWHFGKNECNRPLKMPEITMPEPYDFNNIDERFDILEKRLENIHDGVKTLLEMNERIE